jgi:hypothetical protein
MKPMKLLLIGVVIAPFFFAMGCGPKHVTKGDKFPLLYQERPVTILVLPPINQTTAADAKEYYATTIAEPLSLFGYYVLPIEVTSEILKMEGIYDTELLLRTPPQKFKTYFGADAVLYTTIEQWDVSYLVLSSKLTVAIRCVLKSAVSGETLWQRRSSVEVDLSGSNQSSAGYLGIVFKVAATAIKTAMADYVPYAMQANYIALATIPAGKYHPMHGKDGNEKFIDQVEAKK